MTKRKCVDWNKVSENYYSDIFDYIKYNDLLPEHKVMQEKMASLTPHDAFHYWLQWNGLIGYTETLLKLIEQLGLLKKSLT